jgi:hypothetical protein
MLKVTVLPQAENKENQHNSCFLLASPWGRKVDFKFKFLIYTCYEVLVSYLHFTYDPLIYERSYVAADTNKCSYVAADINKCSYVATDINKCSYVAADINKCSFLMIIKIKTLWDVSTKYFTLSTCELFERV